MDHTPDNGSIWLLVQVLAGPILVLTVSNVLVNVSIHLLVQNFPGPDAEPFSGLHCICLEFY